GKRAGALARPQGRVGFADAPMRGNRKVSSHKKNYAHLSPKSYSLRPLQERRAPGKSRSESRQQDVVAALHAALANGFLERERNRRARGVAVLIDVDGDPFDGQTDASRRRVDDAEVRLVRHPQVDLVEPDAGRLADLVRLADEDVDRELEHVRPHHVDIGGRVLRRVSALLDVAAGHLRVAPPVRTQAPAEETS